MKLEIELVPQGCWYTNLRNVFSNNDWKLLSDSVRDYHKTGGKCCICGSIPHPTIQDNKYLEAHEQWEYEILSDGTGIIKLKDILPLCPMCHKSKHYGHSQLCGWQDAVDKHLKNINNLTDEELYTYIDKVGRTFQQRSMIKSWKLNIDALKELGYSDLYYKYIDKVNIEINKEEPIKNNIQRLVNFICKKCNSNDFKITKSTDKLNRPIYKVNCSNCNKFITLISEKDAQQIYKYNN